MINSFIHSLFNSFIHLFILFIYSFIHSLIHSFSHSFTYPFIHSLTHSFIHLSTYPSILFIHLSPHLFIDSINHFFFHYFFLLFLKLYTSYIFFVSTYVRHMNRRTLAAARRRGERARTALAAGLRWNKRASRHRCLQPSSPSGTSTVRSLPPVVTAPRYGVLMRSGR